MVEPPTERDAFVQFHMRRRRFLKWLIRAAFALFALALAIPALALKSLKIASSNVASGDQLVFATGNKVGDPILLADLPAGTAVHAFPKGKSNNPNALIELVHLPAKDHPSVVAYSAICTHLGCAVSDTLNAQGNIHCPCHGSIFNPADHAAIVRGPAVRSLPGLPVEVGSDGSITAAGAFDGPIGPQ